MLFKASYHRTVWDAIHGALSLHVIRYISGCLIISPCGVYSTAFYHTVQCVCFEVISVGILSNTKLGLLAAGKLFRGNISEGKLEHRRKYRNTTEHKWGRNLRTALTPLLLAAFISHICLRERWRKKMFLGCFSSIESLRTEKSSRVIQQMSYILVGSL